MSIIYSYPEQSPLNGSDMLVGTSTTKVGGKQTNLTKNFTIQDIADFIDGGAGVISPVASDFQIAVFNQAGTRITGSIMSQDSSLSNGVAGTKITVSGNLDVTDSLIVTKGATIGNQADLITLNSPTRLAGSIIDSNQNTGSNNQILVSSNNGFVTWADYSALNGFGTANRITKWTGAGGATDTIGDSIMTETAGSGATNSRITIAGDLAATAIIDINNSKGNAGQLLSSSGTALNWITPSLISNTTDQLTITGGNTLTPSINVVTGAIGLNQVNLATGAVIQAAITDALIGVLEFRGGFNAATGVIDGGANNLTVGAARVAINVGDFYVVTTAGDFYGDADYPLEVGDQVICQTNALVGQSNISSWVIVQGNVVIATNTILGVSKYPTGNNGLIVDTNPGATQGNVTAKIFSSTNKTGGYVPDSTSASASSFLNEEGAWVDATNASGTVGYVPIFTGARVLGNSSTIFNDTANSRIGIGTIAPDTDLHVEGTVGSAKITSTGGGANLFLESIAGNKSRIRWNGLDSFAIRDDNAGSDRVTILANGDVGVGLTVPLSKLHVKGGSTTTQATAAAFIANSTARFVTTSSNDYGAYIGYANATNDAVAIQSAKANGIVHPLVLNPYGANVGIGTTTPERDLHVKGTSAITRLESTGAGQNAQIDFKILNVSTLWSIGSNISLANTGTLEFHLSGTTKTVMTTAGNVGIGITDPTNLLSLVEADNTVISPPTATWTQGPGILKIQNTSSLGSNVALLSFGLSEAGTVGAGVGLINTVISASSSTSVGDLAFYTKPGGSPTLAERMRINSAGNIKFNEYGVGTLVSDVDGNITSSAGGGEGGPYLPLAGGTLTGGLTGTSATFTGVVSLDGTNQIYFVPQAEESNNEAMRITRSSDKMFFTYGINGPDVAFSFDSSGNTTFEGDLTLNGALTQTTNVVSSFVGNLGIGTTAPLSGFKLDVVGGDLRVADDATTNGFEAGYSAGGSNAFIQGYNRATNVFTDMIINNSVTVKANGNVGIGTAAPDNISSSGRVLSISTPGQLGGSALAGSLTFITNDSNFTSVYPDGVTTEISSISESSTGAAYGLAFSTSTITSSNRAERMRIDKSGNVGIGTSAPDSKLHVRGSDIKIEGLGVGVDVSMVFNNGNNMSTNSDVNYSNIISKVTSGSTGSESSDLSFETRLSGTTSEKMRIESSGNVRIGDVAGAKLSISGSVGTTNGTNALPTHTFYSDLDTGMFRAAANTLAFSTGGTERMRIESTGTATFQSSSGFNIGLKAPNAVLQWLLKSYTDGRFALHKNGVGDTLTILGNGNVQVKSADGVTGAIEVKGGPIDGAVGTINSELNFGANDTSVTGGIGGSIKSVNETTNGAYAGMSFYTYRQSRPPGPPYNTDLKEAMRLTNAGQFLVNQTIANTDADGFGVYPLGSSGGTLVNCYNGDDGVALRVGVNSATTSTLFVVGTTTAGSISHANSNSTSFNISSDYRLKEDLQDFNGLDMISDIPVYDFKWKSDESRSYGVMAHELQEVLPQAVIGEKDATEEYEVTPATLDEKGNVSAEAVMGVRDSSQGVDYSKIVPLLVKSIQELKAEIELLKAR